MVQVGVVRMAMGHRLVPVPVAVRLARRVAGAVGMPVVQVMHMAVRVLHRFMPMDPATRPASRTATGTGMNR